MRGDRKCTKCGCELTLETWGTRGSYNGWKVCKVCRNKYEKVRNKDRKAAIYTSSRKSYLKILYGITPDDYNRLFETQCGCCAICGKHQSELTHVLCVDHNHHTGRVRGLLCRVCNLAAGHIEKYIDRIDSIKQYLSSEAYSG